MYIWLRYANDGTAYSLRLNAIEALPTNVTKRNQRFTLRDAEVDHLISRKSHWSVWIGADEMITGANADWMEEFWCAQQRFLCLNPQETPTPDDSEFIQVTTDGGQSPRQYLEDNLSFPFYQMVLRQKRRS